LRVRDDRFGNRFSLANLKVAACWEQRQAAQLTTCSFVGEFRATLRKGA